MPVLRQGVRSQAIATMAALVGRFYGDGLVWAMSLSLSELARWADLRAHVMRVENGRR